MRFFISVVLLLAGLALPLQAKGPGTSPALVEPTPAKATKAPAKTVAATAPAAAMHAKTKPSLAKTSDKSEPSVIAPNSKSHSASVASGTPSSRNVEKSANGRLARLTAYWAGEGDYYTGHGISSTGIRLHDGHCAVDPRIIPYGSVVEIAGVGKYLAVDTGSAVISREAARETGHNAEERSALVIDLYFASRRDGENFAASGPKYASISWWTPSTAGTQAKAAHLFADENWSKIQSKQL